jgi:hypothetical protein
MLCHCGIAEATAVDWQPTVFESGRSAHEGASQRSTLDGVPMAMPFAAAVRSRPCGTRARTPRRRRTGYVHRGFGHRVSWLCLLSSPIQSRRWSHAHELYQDRSACRRSRGRAHRSHSGPGCCAGDRRAGSAATGARPRRTAAYLGAAEAHRGLEWAPRRVELGLGRPLGRMDQRGLHPLVVKPCHRWRLMPKPE